MSIPFTVLGGYLGAGKTTLVNHLLKNAQGERLALIINDFGAINIDADLISEQTDQQINLTNGCICCGMSAGFDEALERLLALDPAPDRIIVEASGVADVVSLAQYGHHPGLTLDGIIVLADAETVRAKARDKYVDKTVLRQLKGADLIVLNKVDLVTEDKLADLEAWLKEIAPDTPLLRASNARIPIDAVFGLGHPEKAVERQEHSGHEAYVTWHYIRDNAEQPINRSQLDAFLAAIPRGVLRGKGFFQIYDVDSEVTLLYQQVGSRVTLTAQPKSDPPEDSRLVMIGLTAELTTEELDGLAQLHLNCAK
jgi:G3E family GTPase